jgi:hypothetical protein
MNKVLNLVFNEWNGNLPLPNFTHLNTKSVKKFELPKILLENDNIDINLSKLEDVNQSSNYYYIVKHLVSHNHFIDNPNLGMKESVLDCVKHKGLKVIFLNENESYDNIQKIVNKIESFVKLNNLNASNFYLLNNNSSLHTIKSKINLFKTEFLLETLVGKAYSDFNSINLNNRKFTFLLHVKYPRFHRLDLLTLLDSNGLLNFDIIDWSFTFKNDTNFDDSLQTDNFLFNQFRQSTLLDLSEKSLYNSFKKICTCKKSSYYETNNTFRISALDSYGKETMQSYEESYINIVTETYFNEKDIHITEKSFKPFYLYQLPIFLANKNHITTLKKEYGLDTFDDLIDHSYDTEENNLKRMYMVYNEIKRLSKIKGMIKEYYSDNIDRIKKNREIIKKNWLLNKTTNYFLNLT